MKRTADFNVYWELGVDEVRRSYTVSLKQDFTREITHEIVVHEFVDKRQAKDFFIHMLRSHVSPAVKSRNGYTGEGYYSVVVPHNPIHHRQPVGGKNML
jgi:hypothetical protein